MAHPERRKTPRTPINKIAYINVEPYNNGGVITDISGTGLRFHTVEPVNQGGVLRLSIILDAAGRIEAVAELVWTDAARRTGGLRFTVLPDGAADQIRSWAEASKSTETLNSGAFPRTGAIHPASPPNQAVSQPKAATPGTSRGAEQIGDPGVIEPVPAHAAEPGTQSAWLPPSARPSAEMDLADLYLRGDGVARNCDQARVLLSVASEKGNAEAMQKLGELNWTGCR